MSHSANRRLQRQGQTVEMWELRCRVCKRGKLLTKGEMAPMTTGLVPYCADCRANGVISRMVAKRYKSGPPDLIV